MSAKATFTSPKKSANNVIGEISQRIRAANNERGGMNDGPI